MDKFLPAHCGKETDGGSTDGKQSGGFSLMHSMTVVPVLSSDQVFARVRARDTDVDCLKKRT